MFGRACLLIHCTLPMHISGMFFFFCSKYFSLSHIFIFWPSLFVTAFTVNMNDVLSVGRQRDDKLNVRNFKYKIVLSIISTSDGENRILF